VNRLVKALIAHQEVIEQMAGQEDAPFATLVAALGDAVFSGPELHRIQDDLQLRQRLEKAYLPTITAPDWEYALSLTEDRTAINSGWWTVMMPGTSGKFGLTAPQNGPVSDLVALFTGPAASSGILAYDPVLGTVSEAAGGPHCGTPDKDAICFEGRCHECKAHKVYDDTIHTLGIKCLCPHRTE
jgi:hypothetical protein